MRRGHRSVVILVLAMIVLAGYRSARTRALPGHVDQKDIEAGVWSVEQLLEAGRILFMARFTAEDGAGRPGATGNASPTQRPVGSAPGFTRSAGPDANSCLGCHNQPFVGGGGDFVVNVFVGPNAREPVVHSIAASEAAERGTVSIHGAGAIEMLAREITTTLHRIRADAQVEARRIAKPVRVKLVAKGVSYGYITALPNGMLRLLEVEGIDNDLVVRPWNQKGTVTSLRTFTISAMNQHHGMQARERFGRRITGTEDFDRDGVPDELTEGDITALVVFQAALNIPGRVLPRDEPSRRQVARGEVLFTRTGCAECHVPEMVLDNPVFTEPGPYNLEGTLHVSEVSRPFGLDLTREIPEPRLARRADGTVVVRAYTDLKRHRICDAEKPFFCNEILNQGFAPTDEFITRRLWDVGNTDPYGHRGDLTLLRDAIEHHGGEARRARLSFEALDEGEREAIISFLRSLQILPEGSAGTVQEAPPPTLPYASTRIEGNR